MSDFILIAQNKKARHDYFIEDTVEAGIMLKGTEVKSLRQGKGSIKESYAGEEGGEFFLTNCHIPVYENAGVKMNHDPKRMRKLLLKRREIERLTGLIKQKGITLVPLRLYFNKKGIAKLELAIVKGKKQHDKRQTIKDRDWARDKARVLKGERE
ncbi:MAG: SsrA-binding protein SmpB [Alphaproteobacteria bacterium]